MKECPSSSFCMALSNFNSYCSPGVDGWWASSVCELPGVGSPATLDDHTLVSYMELHHPILLATPNVPPPLPLAISVLVKHFELPIVKSVLRQTGSARPTVHVLGCARRPVSQWPSCILDNSFTLLPCGMTA